MSRVAFAILEALQWNVAVGLQRTKNPLVEIAYLRATNLPTMPKIGTWLQLHEMVHWYGQDGP